MTYDSWTDETLFYYDTLLIPANATGSWSYPALVNQKVAIVRSDVADPSGGANSTPPTIVGKEIALSFPGGVPTITATHPAGVTQSVAAEIEILTVGGS
ncbi:hypothetical protein L284_19060 [Novosphingobium lindaniclasticum LE124]|uniref:Uncharacterized protein n=1 Tax=Novosphingobium lindaniclasticum LE124 TaxID=1096930 RepID=T0IJ69_9SPHN|nr:hypothetical protein L284_19060 [Novosphingobium lindaniclasticum LE124]